MRPPELRIAIDGLIVEPPREAGRFVAGHSYSPGTQIQKGERRSRSTEFKPGARVSRATEFVPGGLAHNRAPLGSVRVRIETNTGLPRAWVKVAEPNIWRKRAVVVWEDTHGPLARGRVIHHRDRDSLNDSIENLAALTRKEHADEHRHELGAWRTREII